MPPVVGVKLKHCRWSCPVDSPAGAALGDQRRVMGPVEAQRSGASILVIGRPITGAPDPALAARDIAQSLGISAG